MRDQVLTFPSIFPQSKQPKDEPVAAFPGSKIENKIKNWFSENVRLVCVYMSLFAFLLAARCSIVPFRMDWERAWQLGVASFPPIRPGNEPGS